MCLEEEVLGTGILVLTNHTKNFLIANPNFYSHFIYNFFQLKINELIYIFFYQLRINGLIKAFKGCFNPKYTLFKDGMVDHTEVFSLTQIKVWSWISSKIPSTNFSFSNWCLEPLVCMYSI